jgi:hypothetical protein
VWSLSWKFARSFEKDNCPKKEEMDNVKPYLYKIPDYSQIIPMTKTPIFPSWVGGS